MSKNESILFFLKMYCFFMFSLFQRILLFTWYLASKRQEAETARSVKGCVCNWYIITSDKLYFSTSHRIDPDSIEWRNQLPHHEGVASLYCKRVCGMGNSIVTIFGKCNLPQWQDQKSNLDSANQRQLTVKLYCFICSEKQLFYFWKIAEIRKYWCFSVIS